MTKSVAKTAALAALGVFAFSGLALSAYAAVQESDEPDLLGGPGGPPVGKSRAQAPFQPQVQPKPKPAPLSAPSTRAPLQPGMEAPARRDALPDVSNARISDASPIVEDDESAAPPDAAIQRLLPVSVCHYLLPFSLKRALLRHEGQHLANGPHGSFLGNVVEAYFHSQALPQTHQQVCARLRVEVTS